MRAREQDVARRVVLFSAVVVVAVPAVVWLAERGSNSDLRSFGSAEVWLVRTALEEGSPYGLSSFVAYLVYAVVSVAVIAVVGIGTGAVSGRLTGAVVSRRAGTGVTRAKDHLLVSGWNSRGPEIVADVRRAHPRRPVVVIVDCPEPPPDLGDAEFVRGDPTDADDLCRAGAHRAATVVVLADAAGDGDPAGRSARALLSCLAVEALNNDCHTVVEVARPADRALFGLARADEVVSGSELTGALLARSAHLPGVSTMVTGLLTSRAPESIHLLDLPGDLAGRHYAEVLAALKDRADVLVVGVRGPVGVEVNPAGHRTVLADEELVVLGVAARP